MRIERLVPGQVIEVVLSRRNLTSLLAKLNGYPPNSACTITRDCGEFGHLVVRAEPDSEHYDERSPGAMHPITEAALSTELPRRLDASSQQTGALC
jgi:hypothetical protein